MSEENRSWADSVVEEVTKRNKKEYICAGGWSPSGYFHIGNARPEIFTSGSVHNALVDNGFKSRFLFIIDDFDGLKSIPKGLDIDEKKFKEYLGQPYRLVPSPVPGFDSWGDYFMDQIKSVIENYGFKPEWISSYENYKAGLYNDKIRQALDKAPQAINIWNEIAGSEKPQDLLPIQVICEQCKSNLQNQAKNWNPETETVQYICKCGYQGEISPFNGNTKLHWRLDWPMRWSYFPVDFESGGKDHFSPGGSVDTGKVFCEKIFETTPPVMLGSEFIQMGGKKISGSKDAAVSLEQWLNFAPPELFRYLNISYNPSKVIEFDPSGQSFILLLDRYDTAERIFYKLEEDKTEKLTEKWARVYELSQINLREEMPIQVPFTYQLVLSQLINFNDNFQEIEDILTSSGHITKPLTEQDKQDLIQKLTRAKFWADNYASDQFKYTFIEEVPEEITSSLDPLIKKTLTKIADQLDQFESADDIQSMVFEETKAAGIKPKEMFQALYGIVLGKSFGPKIGSLILAIGKEKIKQRLKENGL